jgi:hypothetical protein
VIRHKKVESSHLATPINSRSVPIQRLHWRKNLKYDQAIWKIRYSSSNCIQDIFGFICNYVLSYSDPGQEYIVEVYIDHLQIDEPQETKPQVVDHVHTHTPVHIPDTPVEIPVRHKPHALSPTLAKPPDGYKPPALPPIPVKSQTDTSLWFYLLFSMTSLPIIAIICPGLMEKM